MQAVLFRRPLGNLFSLFVQTELERLVKLFSNEFQSTGTLFEDPGGTLPALCHNWERLLGALGLRFQFCLKDGEITNCFQKLCRIVEITFPNACVRFFKFYVCSVARAQAILQALCE